MLSTEYLTPAVSPADNQLEQILRLCHQLHGCSNEELQANLCQMGFSHPAQLVYAVRLLLNGSVYLHQQLPAAQAEGLAVNAVTESVASLSKRELEVLALLAKGCTLPQIGEQLFVSPATVNNHCARMRGKLGLQGRNALIRYALSLEA